MIMLHFVIGMNKSSNNRNYGGVLGLAPLGARSIMLSVLLGTHPPVLSGQQLVGLAELFGIRAGTARTALSRMVASGELSAENGRYSLGSRMLQRQRQQDEGRLTSTESWDRRWFTAIAATGSRSVAERRSFRSAMVGARLAELRPDIWMRPANIAPPESAGDVLLLTGELDKNNPIGLVDELWPLGEINLQSSALIDALTRSRPSLDNDDPSVLQPAFMLSAAAVRFLRVEPQLPLELVPHQWSPPELRPVYDDFEEAFQRLLRVFLRGVGTDESQ